jgi:hypothetical protein
VAQAAGRHLHALLGAQPQQQRTRGRRGGEAAGGPPPAAVAGGVVVRRAALRLAYALGLSLSVHTYTPADL